MNRPIKFQLIQISTDQFAILSDVPDSKDKITLNHKFRFSVNFSNRLIVATCRFQFLKNEAPFLLIESSCHFIVHQDDWNSFIIPNKNSIILPKEFAAHLQMLAVGTARGSLHTKTENTPFRRFHLPLINVLDSIQKDIIINIDEKS